MATIAIVFFPGQNTELETIRAIEAARMQAELVRWNEPFDRLNSFDGFIIPGGFSYEDRGRAGLVAALDPMVHALKREAAKGKPVLGICNGAQILLESGMVPGARDYKLAMALARNKRIRGEEVLGTGYYNTWVYMKHLPKPTRSAFTLALKGGEIYRVPVAHGEGRFTTIYPKLIDQLFKNEQVVFQYCDREGNVKEDFPVNPNGAMGNIAALCNAEGNVMSIMPHAERGIAPPVPGVFESIRLYTTRRKMWRFFRPRSLNLSQIDPMPRKTYRPEEPSFEFRIDLMMNDNEAETLEETAHRLGMTKVTFRRQTHYEVTLRDLDDWEREARRLITCGELLNTNKDIAHLTWQRKTYHYKATDRTFAPEKKTPFPKWTFSLLVREKKDFVGMSKKSTLRHRLHYDWVREVKKGTLYHVTIAEPSRDAARKIFGQLVRTNLFANPHAQDSFLYEP